MRSEEHRLSVIPLTGIERELTYRCTADHWRRIAVGSLVKIPLLSRTETGLVTSLDAGDDLPSSRLKFIHSLVQPFPVLTEDLI